MMLTDSEIDALPYMLWIRNELKKQVHATMAAVAYESTAARLEDRIVMGVIPDALGVMFRYDGDTMFIPSGQGHLQVETGKLVFIDAEHRVWVDTATIRPTAMFMAQTVRLGEVTKSGYVQACQERLLRFNPNPPQTVCVGADQSVDRSQPLSHLGVRIQR